MDYEKVKDVLNCPYLYTKEERRKAVKLAIAMLDAMAMKDELRGANKDCVCWKYNHGEFTGGGVCPVHGLVATAKPFNAGFCKLCGGPCGNDKH